MLDAEFAATIARTALQNVATEYPYKLDQVLGRDDDVQAPRARHPVFHGSYDWHSCVHMHWTLARLLRHFPHHSHADATRRHFDARLTPANVRAELTTLDAPLNVSFERPYGWAWLLKLAAELKQLAAADRACSVWSDALTPLAQAFADRFIEFLPRATYPTRTGTHGNSAFALLLALDYCEVCSPPVATRPPPAEARDELGTARRSSRGVQHRALHRLIAERANLWFGRDRRYPADYEPSGDDFLSGGMVEAALMRRVIDGSFADWWEQFQPRRDAIGAWLQPIAVSDGSDPKIVHLHGLNLSRAWCWRQLWPELDVELQRLANDAIERHLSASVPAATQGAYVGTHWLASFALLALTTEK